MGLARELHVRRLADARREVEGRNNTRGINPTSDTQFNAHQNNFSLSTPDFVLAVGIIHDTVPFNYLYRVATDLTGMPITCCTLQNSIGGALQASAIQAYSIGTHVVIAYSRRLCHGIILGAYEKPQNLSEYNIKMNLSSVCRTPEEPTYKGVLLNAKKKKANGTFNAAQLKFEEHTDVPEYGVAFITGMKLFMDPYMALFNCDDYTGVSLFDKDSLLRISGINYQMRTSGREEEYLNDEGEYIEYRGSSIYPWEHFGRYIEPDADIMDSMDYAGWHKEGSTDNYYMPSAPNLRPFHRVMQFGGWLGQGELTQIIAPPEGVMWAQYEIKEKTPRLTMHSTGIDGHTDIRSAGGVSITKDGMSPAAIRIVRPDEISKDLGDNKETYKHEKLLLPKEIEITASENPRMQEVLGILDYSGYNKNWRDVFQLAYHYGDYYLPEESEMGYFSIQSPTYSTLKGSYMLPDSDGYKLKLDGKDYEKSYAQNEAGIHILPSGGIVIYDGAGSEIRMVGGNVTISCAGDIGIKCGRNVLMWGGRELSIRANKGIDMSSTKESVRIKAERNLELLGANDGKNDSGVIIESKSKSNTYNYSKLGDDIITNGIVLKAARSPVAILGDVAYIRSGVGEEPGNGVYIDSARGVDDVYVIANGIKEYLNNEHSINFTDMGTGEVSASTYFNRAINALHGQVTISSNVNIDGKLNVADSIASCSSITSYLNKAGLIFVMTDGSKDQLIKMIEKAAEMPNDLRPKDNTTVFQKVVQETVYGEERIGDNNTEKGIGFSFRTDDQINLPGDYYIYEDLWQHIANNTGNGSKWNEYPVVSDNGKTFPFPGKKFYYNPTYVTQETVIADFGKRNYIDRKIFRGDTKPTESKYANPKYGKQEKKTLNDYIII